MDEDKRLELGLFLKEFEHRLDAIQLLKVCLNNDV